jgi:geranylgeranyl pyrophosphate synthase
MLIDRARAAISNLPESQEKQILDTLAEFVISRPM